MTRRRDSGGMKAFVVFLAFSAIAIVHAAVLPDVTITMYASSSISSGPSTSSGSQTTTAAATTSSASVDQAAILSSLEAGRSSDQARISHLEAQYSNMSTTATAATAAATATPSTTSAVPTWNTTDPRFEITDRNWNGDYHPLLSYAEWGMANRDAIIASPKGEVGYYLYSVFGITEATCGVGTPVCGCNFDLTHLLRDLQEIYPDNFEKAQEVYFTLNAMDVYLSNKCEGIEMTRLAGMEASLLDPLFAETFFQQRDKAKVKACEAKNAARAAVHDFLITLIVGIPLDFLGAEFMTANIGGAARAILRPSSALENAAQRVTPNLVVNGAKGAEESLQKPLAAVAKVINSKDILPKGGLKKAIEFYSPKHAFKFGFTTALPKWIYATEDRDYHEHIEANPECGIAIAEDRRYEDFANVNRQLAEDLTYWPMYIEAAMSEVIKGSGTGPNGTYVPDEFSEFATHLMAAFTNASDYHRMVEQNKRAAATQGMLKHKYTVASIQKVWSGQHGSLQCGPNPVPGQCQYLDIKGYHRNPAEHPELYCPPKSPNMICQAVNWQGGTDAGNVPLHGIANLTDPVWQLKATDIYEASLQAYSYNSTASYIMVQDGQLGQWELDGNIRYDTVPLLAVSYSEFMRIQELTP
ncbi:hypothetical protein LTR56_005425 [Elasticomyces elasticus]|nr:hypothetical protein LTR22_015243 [Elasticomyces elasticus]KAK3651916.1 hypothetical protein LTR56_005425 [Elasticomyces elasticus]KAK4927811.1 hypothetical protein LTR49_005437 [Elasticomyces elasticus]KAK5761482.1 hypothetical protein LTS12_008445 [Elasticomyces elasticus]